MTQKPDFLLRDPKLAEPLLDRIRRLAEGLGRVKIMEVCGTHTVSLRQSGVHSLLPENISFISGPGCPVCVTPSSYIDNALDLLQKKKALIASFGDMLKVPGSGGQGLASYRSGGDVELVYSAAELIPLAGKNSKAVVFLGIGFETTIPTVAAVIKKAKQEGISNLFVYTAFKTVPEALGALVSDPENKIDAFLLPGHVSVITGKAAYGVVKQHGLPGVIGGFEPLDLVYALYQILLQLKEGRAEIENAYTYAVKDQGNKRAQRLTYEVFQPVDALWRGLGMIPKSGLGFRGEYHNFDAQDVFRLAAETNAEPPGCLCANVIQGKAVPINCSLFGNSCTPEHPVGPCMVSSEGTCAAYLRYGAE